MMLSFLCFLLTVGLTAFSASRFQPGIWHEKLIKPSWNPPNWVFAPVWSILYLFMAISGWLVWLQTHDPFHPALILWILQLFVNGLWSYLFFGRHSPGLALADILALLALIIVFLLCAYSVSTLAALLFIPYLLWVMFAAVLNFHLWQLNRPA
jgi:tryptophan-rich sensory protein